MEETIKKRSMEDMKDYYNNEENKKIYDLLFSKLSSSQIYPKIKDKREDKIDEIRRGLTRENLKRLDFLLLEFEKMMSGMITNINDSKIEIGEFELARNQYLKILDFLSKNKKSYKIPNIVDYVGITNPVWEMQRLKERSLVEKVGSRNYGITDYGKIFYGSLEVIES